MMVNMTEKFDLMGIIGFLEARFAEDEQTARSACQGGSGRWFMGRKWNIYRAETEDPQCGDDDHDLVAWGNVKPQSEHIAAYCPARVLAELEGKHGIIDRLLSIYVNDYDAERIAKFLALPYAGHPDYKPEWSPEWSAYYARKMTPPKETA